MPSDARYVPVLSFVLLYLPRSSFEVTEVPAVTSYDAVETEEAVFGDILSHSPPASFLQKSSMASGAYIREVLFTLTLKLISFVSVR